MKQSFSLSNILHARRHRRKRRAYARAYYWKNRRKLLDKNKKYYASTKAQRQRRQRLSQYGKTAIKHYREQMRAQKGLCSVCGKKMIQPHQDHNHKCCGKKRACSKCLRGLLCKTCNAILHYFENDKLKTAAERYLNKWILRRRKT